MAQRPDVQYVRYYTDGSTARSIAPAVPIKTMKLPKVKKAKKIVLRIDPVAVGGIIMAAIMLVLMAVGVAQLRGGQRQLDSMTAYVENLRAQNQILVSTYEQGYDLEQIERTALALGLVPEDEVRHVTIQVSEPAAENEPGSWERFYIFLTGLFA